jgi:hypothetical protein
MPDASEHIIGPRGRRWSVLGIPVEVAKEKGLMARLLPDDLNVEFLRKPFRSASQFEIMVDLIRIDQDHSKAKLGSPLMTSFDFLLSLTQAGNWVARPRTQVHDFEMIGLISLA